MTSIHPTLRAALVSAALCALAGCGDGSSSASSSPQVAESSPARPASTAEPSATATAAPDKRAEIDRGADADVADGEAGPETSGEDEATTRRASSRERDRRRAGARQERRDDDAKAARERFLLAGDTICGSYRVREKRARRDNDGRKQSQLRYLGKVVELLDETTAAFGALEAPDGAGDVQATYVAKLGELRGRVQEFRRAIDADDGAGAGVAARRVATTSAEARKIARSYGFSVCGAEPD